MPEVVQNLGSWFLWGAGMSAALGLAYKVLPKLVARQLGKGIDRVLNSTLPEDRELVLAFVKWAEKKMPDHGLGVKRYELVEAQLLALFPQMAKFREQLRRLVEEMVWQMDDELKKELTKNQTPPVQ